MKCMTKYVSLSEAILTVLKELLITIMSLFYFQVARYYHVFIVKRAQKVVFIKIK